MLDYAVEKGLCEDTVTQRDLFDTTYHELRNASSF